MTWSVKFFGMFLAAAFLLQGVIPSGYMADHTESGVITAKICGSDGVWLIPIEKKHAPADEQEKQRVDQPCTGAAFAKAIDGSATLEIAPPSPALALYEEHHGPQLVAARARALPPARGPPATV